MRSLIPQSLLCPTVLAPGARPCLQHRDAYVVAPPAPPRYPLAARSLAVAVSLLSASLFVGTLVCLFTY